MKAEKVGKSGGNDSSEVGCSGAARVDQLIESNRDLLQSPDGDRLADEIQVRLLYPWCVDLPTAVSKRLPQLLRLGAFTKRWSWRLLLIYLLYAAVQATTGFYLETQLEAWHKSDMYTDLKLRVDFFVRKVAVWSGLPKMGWIHELAGGECVVGNPVFKKALTCCNCKFNVTLSKVTNVEKVMENFDKLTSSGKPRSFLIINYDQEPVSYQRIRETALANEADIALGYNQFTTLSGPRVSSLHQLFANETAPPSDSALLWRFRHVEGLRHFREFIHRPGFVSRNLEINLDRQFLLLGSGHTERVSLGSVAELDGQVYVVGLSGEIVFTVKSNPQCCKKAENRVTHTATIRPGRLLSLPSSCYEVLARRNGTEPAMAFMGSVAMTQHPATERGSKGRK